MAFFQTIIIFHAFWKKLKLKTASVCDEVRWIHIKKQSSESTGFREQNAYLINKPSSFFPQKATLLQLQGRDHWAVQEKHSSGKDIQAVHLFPAGGQLQRQLVMGGLN